MGNPGQVIFAKDVQVGDMVQVGNTWEKVAFVDPTDLPIEVRIMTAGSLFLEPSWASREGTARIRVIREYLRRKRTAYPV